MICIEQPEPYINHPEEDTCGNDTEKKNRRWAFGIIGFFALVSIATYAYNEYYIYLSAYLWFGLIYGMCLQYGRFCFASAFSDLFAVGVPRMVVGIMIATVPVQLRVRLRDRDRHEHLPFRPDQRSCRDRRALSSASAWSLPEGALRARCTNPARAMAFSMIVILSISVTQALFADAGGCFN